MKTTVVYRLEKMIEHFVAAEGRAPSQIRAGRKAMTLLASELDWANADKPLTFRGIPVLEVQDADVLEVS